MPETNRSVIFGGKIENLRVELETARVPKARSDASPETIIRSFDVRLTSRNGGYLAANTPTISLTSDPVDIRIALEGFMQMLARTRIERRMCVAVCVARRIDNGYPIKSSSFAAFASRKRYRELQTCSPWPAVHACVRLCIYLFFFHRAESCGLGNTCFRGSCNRCD